MKAKLISALKVFLFFVIGVFLFWLAFRGQNITEIVNKLEHANYYWVLFSCLFGFLSNVSRSARWNMLIEPSGYKPRLINTFSAVTIGYFANLAVPRLGEVSRCAVLNRYEKVPVSNLLGTVVVERITDLLTMVFFLIVTVVLQFGLLSDFAINNFLYPVIGKFSSLAEKGMVFYILLLTGIVLLVIIFRFLFRKLKTTSFYQRFSKLLTGFTEGLRAIGKLKNPWMFLFHSVFIWLMYAASTYFCFYGLDFTSHLSFLTALTVMSFGAIGFAVPVQGGIGAYHFVVTQTLIIYGLSYEEGLTFATLAHAAQTVLVIIAGILFFFLLPLFNRKTKTNESH